MQLSKNLVGRTIRASRVVIGGGPGGNGALLELGNAKVKKREADDLGTLQIAPQLTTDWQGMDKSQRMGQMPSSLITTAPRGLVLPKEYMTVGDFNKYQDKINAQALTELGGTKIKGSVYNVRKTGRSEYLVQFVDGISGKVDEVVAGEVFMNIGATRERRIEASIPIDRRGGKARPFPEMMTSRDVLGGGVGWLSRSVVMVVGDGPTAVWTAWKLRQLGVEVILLGPADNPKAFANANPGGRNNRELRDLTGNMGTAQLEGIEERSLSIASDTLEPGMLVTLRDYRRENDRSGRRNLVMPVTAIVSAIGSGSDIASCIEAQTLFGLSPFLGELGFDVKVPVALSDGEGLHVIGASSHGFQGMNLMNELGALTNQPAVGVVPTMMANKLFMQTKLGRMQKLGLMDLHPQSCTMLELDSGLLELGVSSRADRQVVAEGIVKKRQEATGDYTNEALASDLEKLLKE